MSLKQKKSILVEEITLIPDAYERLGYIVERGKKADGLTEDLRTIRSKLRDACLNSGLHWLTKKDFVASSPSLTLLS